MFKKCIIFIYNSYGIYLTWHTLVCQNKRANFGESDPLYYVKRGIILRPLFK